MLQCNITAAALENTIETTNSAPSSPTVVNLVQFALVHQWVNLSLMGLRQPAFG
jgi:hypothetical protein